MKTVDAISRFYHNQLPEAEIKNNILQAPCPFCRKKSGADPGRIIVILNPDSYFHGYFRCLNRCVPGGFLLYFARLLSLDMMKVPGYDPDRLYESSTAAYPRKNINNDIDNYMTRLTDELVERFKRQGIGRGVLGALKIGYNGRYLVYPYIEEDGNCYAARCVHPEMPEDSFWHGDEEFIESRIPIFNRNEIQRCENGTLIVVENEDNLLTLAHLGLPGIALPTAEHFEKLDAALFKWLNTVFLWVNHSNESEQSARNLATRLGFKARLVRWPDHTEKKYSLAQLASDQQKNFQQAAFKLIRDARAFSPFSSPEKEFLQFQDRLQDESGDRYHALQSGFSLLDQALGGIHGINILGGTPKSGKSIFFIQVATEMARRKLPVIYYDFENGRQKIYQRTICRLSRLAADQILQGNIDGAQTANLQAARDELRRILPWFRVVTDRKLTPEIMRRHIDFLRHETKNPYTLVVIDSLHKLPFKDFSERRTGIDAWLRQLESIRDEMNVSFLVISELSRGKDETYDIQPHLGSFKGTGDIEYSADNALVLLPAWDPFDNSPLDQRHNSLWLVASREHSPGKVADYRLDYPFWGFEEKR